MDREAVHRIRLRSGRGRAADGRSNIVFDLHAYERWLEGSGEPNTDLASVEARIQSVRSKSLALLFGEIGPMNAGALMNPASVLKAARRQNISTISVTGSAWVTDIWPGPQWSRFVRIIQTGSAPSWWSIAELDVRQD
jgi:hypothetical protein